jgi:hypothetical protein
MRDAREHLKPWDCSRSRRGLGAGDEPLNRDQNPPLGAHVVSPRCGFAHHGIYVGQGRVVQYGGFSSGLRRAPIEEVSLSRFSDGCPIWIRVGNGGWRDRPEVVGRARSRLGENRYRVLPNNCEHFCEWCMREQSRSYQVEELFGAVARARQVVEALVRMVLAVRTVGFTRRPAARKLQGRAHELGFTIAEPHGPQRSARAIPVLSLRHLAGGSRRPAGVFLHLRAGE